MWPSWPWPDGLLVIAYWLLTQGRSYRSAQEQAEVRENSSPTVLIGC